MHPDLGAEILADYLEDLNRAACSVANQASILRDRQALIACYEPPEAVEIVVDRALKLAQRIIVNHPFMDGNKRTAYLFIETYLQLQGYQWMTNKIMKYDLIMALAGEGEIDHRIAALCSPLDEPLSLDEIIADGSGILQALAAGPDTMAVCPVCGGWCVELNSETCPSCHGEGCSRCDNGQILVDIPCGMCKGEGGIPPREFLEVYYGEKEVNNGNSH